MPEPINHNDLYEDRKIPLALIDEPDIPERQLMEERDLGDLALSILEQGLIKPIAVRQNGERFVTLAGHRRLLACRMVNYDPVPCRLKLDDRVHDLAVLVAENAYVEPVNAVDEARFFLRVLQDLCGNDVDQLCVKLRRKRNYVEDRLIMLNGHPNVVEALQQRQITFAVARELNKVTDPARVLIWLDLSITAGSSARQIESWRREAEGQQPIQYSQLTPEQAAEEMKKLQQDQPVVCWICSSTEDPHMMDLVYMHRYCQRMMLQGSHPALQPQPQQQQ